MLQKAIENKLSQFQLPIVSKFVNMASALQSITISESTVEIVFCFKFPLASLNDEIKASLTQLLSPIVGDKTLKITLKSQIEPHAGHSALKSLPNVKNMIAVASGKGGVGKSTIAYHLALGLHEAGARVGLLDADIYGPSQPILLGTEGKKPVIGEHLITPIESHGIQTMSIGYLIDKSSPMVWRGPMLGKAMQQLIHDTTWKELDYLVIDLPPGTGDVQLTLCQKIPISAALMITTPQELAIADVRRACNMFVKLSVPILGFIENMSTYFCPNCRKPEPIFGQGGGIKLASEYRLPLFAELPLDPAIRESSNATPEENPHAKLFREIAIKVAASLSLQQKDYSASFPKIVVEQIGS